MIIFFSWSHKQRFHRYYQYLLLFFLSSLNSNDDRDFFFSLCKFFIICCPTCPLWINTFKQQIYRCQHSKLHFTSKVRFISFSLVFFWFEKELILNLTSVVDRCEIYPFIGYLSPIGISILAVLYSRCIHLFSKAWS